MARQHNICQFVSFYKILLTLAVKDNQRRTIYTKQLQINMQQQTTGKPYLLKEKQCIQQITRPRTEWVKTQDGNQHFLYQLLKITFAPLPPPSILTYLPRQIPHPVR